MITIIYLFNVLFENFMKRGVLQLFVKMPHAS